MDYLLICEMCNHLKGTDTHQSVLSFEGFLKLNKHSMHQDFAYIWQLWIDDGNKSSKDMSEVRWGWLRFKNSFGKKTPASDQVVIKEFKSNRRNVLDINFVDDTIDWFA